MLCKCSYFVVFLISCRIYSCNSAIDFQYLWLDSNVSSRYNTSQIKIIQSCASLQCISFPKPNGGAAPWPGGRAGPRECNMGLVSRKQEEAHLFWHYDLLTSWGWCSSRHGSYTSFSWSKSSSPEGHEVPSAPWEWPKATLVPFLFAYLGGLAQPVQEGS